MLDFSFVNQLKNRKIGEGLFRKIFEKAITQTGLAQKQVGLSITLVGESKIKSLNSKHRGKNKITDVLSFPIVEFPTKDDILELGDIFICLPVAETSARSEKVSLNSKLEFLAVHGFLHLIGYDHQTEIEMKIMSNLEKRILRK
jgi:probable rRNA maturation factor